MQDGSPIDQDIEPTRMIVPRRKVTGMSAILLPFLADGEVDWDGFDRHVGRTLYAGLTPAVNMDTGYVNLIDEKTREAVLSHTKNVAGGKNFAA
ncbi:MAG: dihydrodipicolinate synthase family protein, partial [Candidatus Brocadiia bacterium]